MAEGTACEAAAVAVAACGRYLHGDLELVEGADVLHQHRDDESMRDALKKTDKELQS